MMKRDKNDLLARIKKCLALGKSSNPHEAAAAMRQAQKLMAMAGVTAEDVALAGITEAKLGLSSKTLPRWHHGLISTVARGFGCECMLIRSFFGEPFVFFIGTAARVEVASYAYTVLRRQIMGARKIFIAGLSKNCKTRSKTLRADSYCEGFVMALQDKVQALTLPAEERKLLDGYMHQHYPDLKKAKCTRDDDKAEKERAKQPDYRYQGYCDGRNATLNHAVSGSTHRPASLEYQS